MTQTFLRLLWVLCIFYIVPLCAMNLSQAVPAKPAISPEPKKTLYNYFGISNAFAGQANKDIKKQWVKEFLNDQEWWYTKEKKCLTDVPTDNVAYSSDGNVLIAACRDKTLRFIDQRKNDVLIKKYESVITGLVCSPNESFVIVSLDNQTIEKVDLAGRTLEVIKDVSNSKVIAMHPEGLYFCTRPAFGEPNVIPHYKIWSLKGGIPLHSEIPNVGSKDFAFCSGVDRNLRVTNCVEYRLPDATMPGNNFGLVHTLQIPQCTFTAVAVHPGDTLFAIGADNGSIKILKQDLKQEEELICFVVDAKGQNITKPINKLHFTTQKNCLVAASDKTVFVFKTTSHLKSWKCVSRLSFSDQKIVSLACDPFKQQIAVASDNDALHVWKRFDEPKLEHILLRLVLKEHLARCILEGIKPQCPDEKQQESDDAFIGWMSKTFNITTGSLKPVWRLFPADMRKSIIRSYVHRACIVRDLPALMTEKRKLAERKLDEAKRAEQNAAAAERRAARTQYGRGYYGNAW